MEISRPDGLGDIADLGLTLSEAKQLLANVQREIVAAQARDHVVRRPDCPRCDGVCRVKDYRDHAVATLFGQVTMKLPRFRCARCGGIETGISWPSHCRSTPELDRLRAHLSALMTYRVAADLLEQMFPIDAGTDPETLRRHTLRVGEALADRAAIRPETAAPAITVTLDSTFIRSCEDGERHLEVRVGNVETKSGARQVFGAVAKTDTDIKVLIRRSLDAIGRTEGTELTAFTDGCPGLRRILADAGVAETPILDWFHIGMRLQHLKQIGRVSPTGDFQCSRGRRTRPDRRPRVPQRTAFPVRIIPPFEIHRRGRQTPPLRECFAEHAGRRLACGLLQILAKSGIKPRASRRRSPVRSVKANHRRALVGARSRSAQGSATGSAPGTVGQGISGEEARVSSTPEDDVGCDTRVSSAVRPFAANHVGARLHRQRNRCGDPIEIKRSHLWEIVPPAALRNLDQTKTGVVQTWVTRTAGLMQSGRMVAP